MKQYLIALVISLYSASLFAYDFTVDNIYYNIISKEDKTCEVIYKASTVYSYTGDIVIPSVVKNNEIDYKVYYPVSTLKNLTAGWWSNFSKDNYILLAGERAKFRFYNYSNMADRWNNWCLYGASTTHGASGYIEYFGVRCDNWDNTTGSNNGCISDFNLDTFKTDMDGSLVDMEVEYTTGGVFNMTSRITTKENKIYHYSYTNTISAKPASLVLFFVNEKSYIDGSSLEVADGKPILATFISLSETSRTLNVGEHFTLSPTILPNNTTSQVVSWSSTDNNVASVSNGVVTAIASGNATITAKATDGSGCSATCNITVNKYQQSIAWEQDLIALRVDGEMVELDATSSSGLPVTYKIADESIASYFDMGSKKYINPNKEGTTTITARQEGNDKYSPAEITKTVVVQASAGIENIENPDALVYVYNLHGMKLRVFSRNDFNKDVSSGMIKAGVYIVNGKKIIIR